MMESLVYTQHQFKDLDLIAGFYDLDYGDVDYDLAFYQNFAQRCGSPLLELGVGTGRVAIPLAKAGFQVTGIDVSPEMLAMTRAKLDKNLQKRVRIVQGDMRQFDLGERFNMAFYALRSFAHLTTTAAQIQSLECVKSHLAEDGLLLIDLHNPNLARLVESDRELILAWVKPNPTGEGTIAKFESFTVDPARQSQQVTFFYDETDAAGMTRRTIASFALRYFFRYEVELLLDHCGFEIEALFGSYDLDDYGPDSEEMIFAARKR